MGDAGMGKGGKRKKVDPEEATTPRRKDEFMKRKNKSRSRAERKSLEIQFWLRKRQILQKDLARQIGVHEGIVSRAITGNGNNRRVLRHLKKIGVPENYLGVKK